MARRQRTAPPTPRRRKVWADLSIADDGFAEDALRSNDLLADYISAGGSSQGVTVLRTIVTVAWSINEAHTPKEKLTFGLIKGTTAAADVADPINEEYADWAYLSTRYAGRDHGLVTADAGNYVDLDVKSMRRIDEVGETWWLIYRGTAPATATATYDVRARVRTLLLLP